jgi:hypothetical protein
MCEQQHNTNLVDTLLFETSGVCLHILPFSPQQDASHQQRWLCSFAADMSRSAVDHTYTSSCFCTYSAALACSGCAQQRYTTITKIATVCAMVIAA